MKYKNMITNLLEATLLPTSDKKMRKKKLKVRSVSESGKQTRVFWGPSQAEQVSGLRRDRSPAVGVGMRAVPRPRRPQGRSGGRCEVWSPTSFPSSLVWMSLRRVLMCLLNSLYCRKIKTSVASTWVCFPVQSEKMMFCLWGEVGFIFSFSYDSVEIVLVLFHVVFFYDFEACKKTSNAKIFGFYVLHSIFLM